MGIISRFVIINLLGLFLLMFNTGVANSAVFTVTPTSDADCSDFDCDLQSALTAAESNGEADTINIAAGVYNVTSTLSYSANEDFSLTLQGAGAASTILDGGNSVQVMHINTSTAPSDSNTTIRVLDLTVRNGNDSITDGAGIEFDTTDASVIIERCIFDNNQIPGTGADDGGAIAIFSSTGNIIIRNNQFTNNFAEDSAGAADLSTIDGNIEVINNIFSNNTANTDTGGAVRFYTNTGYVLLDGNIFEGNRSLDSNSGGGVEGNTATGVITLTNNVFYDNYSTDNGGGAVLSGGSTVDYYIINNTFYNNLADGLGGGLLIYTDSAAYIYNNIFWNNTTSTAGNNGDDLYINTSTTPQVNLVTNLFSPNADFTTGQSEDLFIVDTTNYYHAGNFSQDPLLMDPANGDYHLQETSPCRDAGTNAAPRLPSRDFEGESRVMNSTVDIGADEYFVMALVQAIRGGGGSCFIATAAYGSYFEPHVKVLRDFRDKYLLTNPIGRMFVNFYYKTSPPIAEFISKHESLRAVVRWILTPLVYAIKYPLAAGIILIALIAAPFGLRKKRWLKLFMIIFLLSGFFFTEKTYAADAHIFKVKPGEQKGIVLQSTNTTRTGTWSFSLFVDSANTPVETTTNRRISKHQVVTSLAGAYGVNESFDIGVELGLLLDQDGVDITQTNSVSSSGFGDIRVYGKYRFYQTDDYRLALSPFIVLNTGKEDDWFGEDGIAAGLNLIYDRELNDQTLLLFNLGCEIKEKERISNTQEIGHLLMAGIGIHYTLNDQVNIIGELYGQTPTNDLLDSNLSALEIDISAGYKVNNKTRLIGGLGYGLNHGFGAPRYRIFIGSRFQL